MKFLAHFLQLLRVNASPCDVLLSSLIDNRPLFLDSVICICAGVTGATTSAIGAPRNLQLNEYGKTLYFNAGVNIAAAITAYVEFTDPHGKVVEVLSNALMLSTVRGPPRTDIRPFVRHDNPAR